MRRSRSYLLVAMLLMSMTLASGVEARMQRAHAASRVVTTYFLRLNEGFKTGDFSGVVALYAADGMLTQTSPAGVTKVFQGRAQILGFYSGIYKKYPSHQGNVATQLVFTRERVRSLSASIVLSYEVAATPQLTVPGHCAHLFDVRDGHIQSLDWVTVSGPRKP